MTADRPAPPAKPRDGHHWVAREQRLTLWAPVTGKTCRAPKEGSKPCGATSVAEVLRPGQSAPRWWAFCADDMARRFGAWIEGDRVWAWVEEPIWDGSGDGSGRTSKNPVRDNNMEQSQ